jgi:hypothetical protein
MSDIDLGSIQHLEPIGAPEAAQGHDADARDTGHSIATMSYAAAVAASGQLADQHQSCTVDTSNASVVQRDGVFYVIVPQDSAAMSSAANALTPQQVAAPQSIALSGQDVANPLLQHAAANAPLAILMTHGRPMYVGGRTVVPAKAVSGEAIGSADPLMTDIQGEFLLQLDGESVVLVVSTDELSY